MYSFGLKFFGFILILLITTKVSFSYSLSRYLDFQALRKENPKILRVKVPFEYQTVLIGLSQEGFIEEKSYRNKKFFLHPLQKYKLTFNLQGKYNLFWVKENTDLVKLGEISFPFVISLLKKPKQKTKENNQSKLRAIFFNQSWYRGKIYVLRTPTFPIAINQLELEEFLWSFVSSLTSNSTRSQISPDSIKASAVMFRSSFLGYILNNKTRLSDLSSKDFFYYGVKEEKESVVNLIKQTKGQILLSAQGDLLPINPSALSNFSLSGSVAFEKIGKRTNSWEKIFSEEKLKKAMSIYGYFFSKIEKIEKKVVSSNLDLKTKSITVINISGLDRFNQSYSLEFPVASFQNLLSLPSSFFRIYQANSDTGTYYQFIGNFLDFRQEKTRANRINLLKYLSSYYQKDTDYEKILENLYPLSYLVSFD